MNQKYSRVWCEKSLCSTRAFDAKNLSVANENSIICARVWRNQMRKLQRSKILGTQTQNSKFKIQNFANRSLRTIRARGYFNQCSKQVQNGTIFVNFCHFL